MSTKAYRRVNPLKSYMLLKLPNCAVSSRRLSRRAATAELALYPSRRLLPSLQGISASLPCLDKISKPKQPLLIPAMPACDAGTRIPLSSFNKHFGSLVELSSVALGAKVEDVSDDFFAEASNLLKVSPPKEFPDQYGPRGSLMDGWESRRHCEKHDWWVLQVVEMPDAHPGLEQGHRQARRGGGNRRRRYRVSTSLSSIHLGLR